MPGILSLGLKAPDRRSNPSPPRANWLQWLTGPGSTAGEPVTEFTAMQISTVWACISRIASAIANCPLKVYEIKSHGREEAVDEPVYHTLSNAPSGDDMSAHAYWEMVVQHLCTWGNHYSQIGRNAAGQVVALWPLPPSTEPHRMPNGELVYRVNDALALGSTPKVLKAADVLHPRLFSRDGVHGMSPIAHSRETLGLAMAASHYGSRFFRNQATPSMVIEVPESVDAKTKTSMRQDWESMQSGVNQHRVAILDQGMKVTPISITPEDAEWIALRGYERCEIAALFGVPPHLIGDNSRLSNSNTENLNLSYVQDCLLSYARRIEAEIENKLFPKAPNGGVQYRAEFSFDARLRGDYASTMAGIGVGRQWGIWTANECRKALGGNPIGPEGDVLLVPVNTVNSKLLLDPNYMGAPAHEQTAKESH